MGNIGKFKSPGTVLILSIVTLGIYSIIWMGMLWQEMKEYTGKGLSGWSLFLLLVPVVNIYIYIMMLIYCFTIPQNIGIERMKLGMPQGLSAVWGLLMFVPVGGLIWMYFVQKNLNELWDAAKSASMTAPMAQPMGE